MEQAIDERRVCRLKRVDFQRRFRDELSERKKSIDKFTLPRVLGEAKIRKSSHFGILRTIDSSMLSQLLK
jgi:hypothetical protein